MPVNNSADIINTLELSPETNEILGRPPRKLYRWGNSMIFILILVVMIVASIIRVPDVVNGRVKITQPENPQPGSDASSASISGNANIRYTGLLKKGQKVLIDLDAYPASQNGTIEGRLEEIQPLASEEKVSFKVSLPNGFVTDRHTIIPVQPVLNGSIHIVVSETSILKKLLPF